MKFSIISQLFWDTPILGTPIWQPVDRTFARVSPVITSSTVQAVAKVSMAKAKASAMGLAMDYAALG